MQNENATNATRTDDSLAGAGIDLTFFRLFEGYEAWLEAGTDDSLPTITE